MVQASKTIGLLHHVGGGDHGEEASLAAVVQNVRKRWPGAAIVGFSMNPEDTRAKHGIPAYPIRQWTYSYGQPVQQPPIDHGAKRTFRERARAAARQSRFLFSALRALKAVLIGMPRFVLREMLLLIRSWRRMRSLDVLVICGGAPLADSGGAWDMPFAVFKWVMLARMAGVKRIVLNVGAGPVNSRASRYFVRRILFSADYVSFRDEESLAVAQRIGFTGKARVFPDNAYALDVPASTGSPVKGRTGPAVGIAPTVDNATLTNSTLQTLGEFGSWLIRNHYSVILFCSHISVDPPAVEKLEAMLTAHSGVASTNPGDPLCRVHQWSVEEIVANISSMDYVTACRFHGVILAHMLNKPVLALSDCRRTTALMKDLGMAQYCMESGACDQDALRGAFTSLVRHREEVERGLAEKLESYRGQLAAQFDELFPCSPGRRC